MSVFQGHLEVVKYLIENGAEIDASYEFVGVAEWYYGALTFIFY